MPAAGKVLGSGYTKIDYQIEFGDLGEFSQSHIGSAQLCSEFYKPVRA